MTSARPRWLAALAAAQIAVLLGLAALAYAASSLGQTVRLRVQPINLDGASAGSEAEIRFAISDLPVALWRGPGALPSGAGNRVFVRVAPAGSGPAALWEATGVFGQQPADDGPGVVLPATLQGTGQRQLHLHYYGLERITVPSGPEEAEFKRVVRDTAGLRVRVVVAPWGTVRRLGPEL